MENAGQLKNVKSIYILKKIIYHLVKNIKLDLIKYNKALQRKMIINIEDYKNLSRIYRIIDKNGHGIEKRVGSNKLVFEGEYLNGKKMEKEKNMINMVI